MPQRGERKTKDGITGEWDGSTWRVVDAAPAASSAPTLGTRKTKDGITGEWDGQAWRVIAAPPPTPPPPPEPELPAEWSDLPGHLLPSIGQTVVNAGRAVGGMLGLTSDMAPGEGLARQHELRSTGRLAPNTFQDVSRAVAADYAQRYSPSNIKQTLITNPGGVLQDVATIALPVAGGAARVAGLPRTAAVLRTAGEIGDVPGQVMKQAVARPVLALSRKVVSSVVNPTVAQLRAMAGGREADKAGRVVDTILDNRLFSDKTAGRQIGAITDRVDAALPGPVGDAPAQLSHVTSSLDDLAAEFGQAKGTAKAKAQKGLAKERETLLADPDLAHTVQTGWTLQPTGQLGANGQPLMRPVPVMERQLKPNIPTRDALQSARATATARGKAPFGTPLSATDRASKATELGLRDAVREALPPGLAADMARQSDLINAQTVLRNASPAPSVLDLGNGLTNYAARLLRANAVRGAVGTHALSQMIQRGVPASAFTRNLLTQLGRQDEP